MFFFSQAEGLEQSHSETVLLDLSKRIGFETKRLNFTFPSDVVPGSERVQVTVIGKHFTPLTLFHFDACWQIKSKYETEISVRVL